MLPNSGPSGRPWRSRFPQVRAMQPIAMTIEVFGGQEQWLPPSLQLALSNEPDCRLQMVSLDEQWMCQLQRNRLVVNWRKRKDDYPRFSATWVRLCDSWQAWQAFLKTHSMSPARPMLWELVYVNRLPQSELWQSTCA